jgi:hypothetical protein
LLLGDLGYVGLEKLHTNTWVPHKKPRNGELTSEQKTENRLLSKVRIAIEHVNRRIKRFRIMSCRYRNKRKRHGLRASLICGIYNFELG